MSTSAAGTYITYSASALIEPFRGEKPSDDPDAFAVAEVLKKLGPKVRRKVLL